MKLNTICLMIVMALVISGCSKQSETSDGAMAPESSSMGQKMAAAKQKIAESADQAISLAKNIETVKAKKDYLIAQATSFYESEEFEQVVEVTQYVLQYVDKDSNVAKELIEKAKSKLQSEVQGKVSDVKNTLGGFGN